MNIDKQTRPLPGTMTTATESSLCCLVAEKKSVRWNEDPEVQLFSKRKCGKNLWYTQDDYNNFQEDREQVIRLVKDYGVKTVESMQGLTCRGLEFMFLSRRELSNRRQSAVEAVMKEQEHQTKCGIASPEAIAQGYFLECEKSIVEAHRLALLYYRENRHADKIAKATKKQKATTQSTQPQEGSSPKLGKSAMKKFFLPFKAISGVRSGVKFGARTGQSPLLPASA